VLLYSLLSLWHFRSFCNALLLLLVLVLVLVLQDSTSHCCLSS
jgi:hypothetical protein